MEKDKEKDKVCFQDLPKALQQKYKNSIVFENEPTRRKKFEFDAQKIKQRKIDKEKTIEEKLEEFSINSTEEKYLLRVFKLLSAPNGEEFFTNLEIKDMLGRMGMQMNKSQIDLMIWEFDENLDRKISEKEFINMYKKCVIDRTAAEPKKLFHFTQFLMYCQPDSYKITVEDTLELLYVRALNEAPKLKANVKDVFESEIKIIFGEDYESERGETEKEISFEEYLEKINKKAIENRKKEVERLKSQLRYH